MHNKNNLLLVYIYGMIWDASNMQSITVWKNHFSCKPLLIPCIFLLKLTNNVSIISGKCFFFHELYGRSSRLNCKFMPWLSNGTWKTSNYPYHGKTLDWTRNAYF